MRDRVIRALELLHDALGLQSREVGVCDFAFFSEGDEARYPFVEESGRVIAYLVGAYRVDDIADARPYLLRLDIVVGVVCSQEFYEVRVNPLEEQEGYEYTDPCLL